jgi:hypothetical protein
MKQITKQTTRHAPGRGKHFAAGAAILCGALLALLAACAVEPVPLYGTWADNHGNSITFADDESFSAKILDGYGDPQSFSGTYAVLQNILALTRAENGERIMTEWDIRGNVLYLTWPDDSGEIALTLFKVSN